MTEKRYYQRDFEELYYIIDSNVISEKEFDEKMKYEEYTAFEDSLTGEEIVDLLNENEQLKQEKKRLIGYLHRYGFVDVEDVDEVVLSKEYLDEWGELYNDER